jgi:hypothetical protein
MASAVMFNYLYRDGGNFKAWGTVVFSNDETVSLSDVEARLRRAFNPDGLFIASQILVPEVFLYLHDRITRWDHCFHEFHSVDLCSADPDDLWLRSIRAFLEKVEIESSHGWRTFDPLDRVS